MIKVIGINFLDANRIYYFSPNNIKLKKGDYVIVETERGMQFGQAVTNIEQMPKEKVFLPLKDVIRKANKELLAFNTSSLLKMNWSFYFEKGFFFYMASAWEKFIIFVESIK